MFSAKLSAKPAFGVVPPRKTAPAVRSARVQCKTDDNPVAEGAREVQKQVEQGLPDLPVSATNLAGDAGAENREDRMNQSTTMTAETAQGNARGAVDRPDLAGGIMGGGKARTSDWGPQLYTEVEHPTSGPGEEKQGKNKESSQSEAELSDKRAAAIAAEKANNVKPATSAANDVDEGR